jgi:hypothetical protein
MSRSEPYTPRNGLRHSLRRGSLGDDVGEQLAFDFRDLVLQHQLALFEALHLQLIKGAGIGDARNDIVEVAMLDL